MRGLYLSRLDEYSRKRKNRCRNGRVFNRSFVLILMVSWLSLFTFIPVSAQGQEGTTGGFQPFNDVAKSLVSENEYKTNKQLAPYVVDNLREPGLQHRYYTGVADGKWPAPAYVEVTFDEPLSYEKAAPDDCLLIYTRRAEHTNTGDNTFDNSHPTAFRVTGFFDGDDKEYDLFYVYFLYRGPYTQEYSSKVLVKKLWKKLEDINKDVANIDGLQDEVSRDKALLKLRFYVTANNNREMGSKGYREMAMSRLDVLGLKKTADYSDTFKDRLHLKSDYVRDYENYRFENTLGILDDHNKVAGWDRDPNNYKSDLQSQGINLTLPDFNFIEPSETTDPPLAEGQKRQPTHTVEHIIYALPGDVVGLYPYYQMYQTTYYEERFSHWYDYRNGGRLKYKAPWSGIEYDLLDFAIDPTTVLISDKYGFYGSQYLNKRGPIVVHNEDEYIAAVNYINNYDNSCYIELGADLDFAGRENVPMLGYDYARAFKGVFNGNGKTIKNLHYNFPEKEGVGFIAFTDNNAIIENLIIDSSCSFIGGYNVGLVGMHRGNHLYVYNVRTEATCIGKRAGEQAAGGILGKGDGNQNRLVVENCYIGGQIGDPADNRGGQNNAAITGWIGTSDVKETDQTYTRFQNVIVRCKVSGCEGDNKYFRKNEGYYTIENCYGNQGSNQGFNNLEDNADLPTFAAGWVNGVPPLRTVSDADKARSEGDRKAGTFATFFCPRNPYVKAGVQHSLPFEEMGVADEDEFVIAADFSQEFTVEKNVETTGVGEGTIYEPIISSRHIFKIRDGKKFADDFSENAEANENFIRKNQKMVSARAGEPFQIRFDTPVPAKKTSRSNYYYKISDDDYRRVCTMYIKVYNAQTGEEVTDMTFEPKEPFESQGTRTIDDISYSLCGGGEQYYRMLECANPRAGNYIVRLFGNDVNGEPIKVCGSDKDLVVMEYNITFLPEEYVTILTEDELYSKDNRYKYARPEILEDQFGEPDAIDFDMYMALNKDADLKNEFVTSKGRNPEIKNPNLESSYFKWPLSWESSNYSFGYNKRHDYNMYMLTTHSWETSHKSFLDKDENKNWNNNFGGDLGVFDRKYYDTLRKSKEKPSNNGEAKAEEIEQGYFYYVNAATDPGVSARVKIDDLCPGSTVHVSAWMAEFSGNSESVNLSFNFVAVLKENLNTGNDKVDDGIKGGDRIVLHSFITGYAAKERRGRWLNVYYSFVPRLSEFSTNGITADMVDHYELELDNNGKSSDGADYAIDDIRVYVAKPEVLASQLAPMCNGEAKVLVESPFSTLLQTCGLKEVIGDKDGEQQTILYTFVDKEKFDRLYDPLNPNYAEAFDKAVLRFDYDGNGDGEPQLYGKVVFNTNLYKNKKYDADQDASEGEEATDFLASYRTGEDGRDMIVFSRSLADNLFKVNKEYYVILSTEDETSIEGKEASAFDLMSECAKVCEVTIKSSNIIKIDGDLVEDASQFVVCENQSPVVQVNVWGQKEDAENGTNYEELKKNATFDWYLGSIEDFQMNLTDLDFSPAKALAAFREEYGDKADFENVEAKGKLTEDMLKWLMNCDELKLYESSYLVPSRSLAEDEEETEVRLVAIPVTNEYDDENLIVCTDPTEIVIKVRNKSPKLRHGFTGITYPMDDVPLRIGLDQLREGTGTGFSMKVVEMPVRHASSTDGRVTSLSLVSESVRTPQGTEEVKTGVILLVATDDADYTSLGTVDKVENGTDDADEEIEYKDVDTGHLLWVGEVTKLIAETSKDSGEAEISNEKLFNVKFHDDFKFKEGYYYSMRFQYSETIEPSDEDSSANDATDGIEAEAEEDENVVCPGHDVFTLKIIPKYLVWTGSSEIAPNDLSKSDNLNWNNDANWSRVDSQELYATATSKEHYVTDGVNARNKAFAPLDFTYVIIKDANDETRVTGMPYLYTPAETDGIKVMHSDENIIWPKSPIPATSASQNYADFGRGPGNVTTDIQFDMAAWSINTNEIGEDVATIGCRPWYMNTCKEIHFKPGSSIMNQQELKYEKAWVDVEIASNKWYMLSSPLQEAYAGDFYLPTASGRQETELFNDMTFNTTDHNRFKPAVYQRGWDKGSANLYELGQEEVRNVIVQTTWSRVYNDVKELYGGGTGFSIRADVSAMDKQPENVMFRLPKNDKSFLYYSQDGKTGHKTDITRSDAQYLLNPSHSSDEFKLTATTQSGDYFLVGNPFMTNMDIKRFLKENDDILEQKYWLITANSQIAGTFDVDEGISTDNTESDATVAPMQGFFVKFKGELNQETSERTIKLNYNESMMRRKASGAGTSIQSTTRSGGSGLDAIRVVAENDGVVSSSALIATGYAANSMKSVEAIDNRGLDIPATVYTIGNGQALSINFCNDAEGVEIGVAADADTETVIRFEGVQPGCDLSLLDKEEYSLTSLYDGMEIHLKGAAAGRYFLTRSSGIEEVYSGIEWSVEGNTLVVYDRSCSGSLDVKVFDTLGREVASESAHGDSVRVALPHGVYVVEIANASERKSAKIRM